MISFISNFKPVLAAAGLILAAEGGFAILGSGIPAGERSNFYQLAYGEREGHAENLIKVFTLAEQSADIISVGDSSGFFGVQPRIVNQSLGSISFLNMNLSADLGFDGYRYALRYYAARHPELKLAVLSVTPYCTPQVFGRGLLTQSFQDNFLSAWRFLTPPVTAWRLPVTNWLYYGRFDRKLYWPPPRANEPSDFVSSFDELRDTLVSGLGWMPFRAASSVATGPCDFRHKGKEDESVERKLQELADTARKKSVKLALIYNPVACEEFGIHSDRQQAQVDAFALKNPDVYIPADIITTFPEEDFADNWHLKRAASETNSTRVGVLLSRYLSGSGKNYYGDSMKGMTGRTLNGTVLSYDILGRVQSERPYQNGKLHGIAKSYYPDHTLKAERTYENGILVGEAKRYYANGSVAEQVTFTDGKESGVSKRYFPNGVVSHEFYFQEGLMEGMQLTYDPLGRIYGEAVYHQGKKHGWFKVRDADKGTAQEYLFKGDEMLLAVSKEFYPGGSIRQTTTLNKKSGIATVEMFAEDGHVLGREEQKQEGSAGL